MLHVALLCLGARAIVHVGPHKTGSTSVQGTFDQLRRAKGHLLETVDNFSLLPASIPGGFCKGGKVGSGVANCFSGRRKPDINCTLIFDYFQQFLHGALLANRNILLSAEEFDNPDMDYGGLATALRGFDTTIVVVYRPYFEWLVSLYTQWRPHMPLEEFANYENISLAVAGSDRSSLATYKRYARHFRNVSLHNLTRGFIEDIVCNDVQAASSCHHLQTTPIEKHVNANRKPSDWYTKRTGCMNASHMQMLWNVSVEFEVQAQAIMRAGPPSLNFSWLRTRFDAAPYRPCRTKVGAKVFGRDQS